MDAVACQARDPITRSAVVAVTQDRGALGDRAIERRVAPAATGRQVRRREPGGLQPCLQPDSVDGHGQRFRPTS